MKNIILILFFLFSLLISAQTDTLNAIQNTDSIEMYQKGFLEGKNFKGNKTLFNSAFASILPLGLVINGALLATPARLEKNRISDSNYSGNKHFVKGYQAAAKKKKNRKILLGTAIGFTVKTGFLIYFLSNLEFNVMNGSGVGF